jgi:hypothetical protein
MLSLVWVDRDRRYFISTAFGLDEGEPYHRDRYRQLIQGCKYTPPEKVQIVVPQPTVCEAYYKTCGAIDQHNRHCVDTLSINKKVKTKDWAKRVNFTILSMIMVDCWQIWSKITTTSDGEAQEVQKEFYSHLATELIKNTFDERAGSSRRQSTAGSPLSGLFNSETMEPRAGEGIHLTPTKRKRVDSGGNETKWAAQGRCMSCKVKLTTWQCSKCVDGGSSVKRSGWVCHTSKGRICFATHVQECHPCDENLV